MFNSYVSYVKLPGGMCSCFFQLQFHSQGCHRKSDVRLCEAPRRRTIFLSVCFNPSPFSNIFQFQHFSNSKNIFLNSKKQFFLLVLVFPYMQRASDAQMRQNHGPFEHLSFYPILSVLNGLLYMTIIWCTFMTLCWCIITIRILYT